MNKSESWKKTHYSVNFWWQVVIKKLTRNNFCKKFPCCRSQRGTTYLTQCFFYFFAGSDIWLKVVVMSLTIISCSILATCSTDKFLEHVYVVLYLINFQLYSKQVNIISAQMLHASNSPLGKTKLSTIPNSMFSDREQIILGPQGKNFKLNFCA